MRQARTNRCLQPPIVKRHNPHLGATPSPLSDMTPSTSGKTTLQTKPMTESAFSRFVVAPVLFASFLVSLFLVDHKTISSIFSEPHYIDTYSFRRQSVRKEVDEAFHLRNRVLGAMLFVGGLSAALFGWACAKAFRTMFPNGFGY